MKLYIDEAGRGPLAGPLHVWVILPLKKFTKKKFKDSKKLTQKQREKLFADINTLQQKLSIEYSVWTVDNYEIDSLWLTKATNLATQRWIFKILKNYYNIHLKQSLWNWLCSCDIINMYSIDNILTKRVNDISSDDLKQLINIIGETNPVEELIIDWNNTFWLDINLEIPVQTIIKWDDKVSEISMASICAKVTRDDRMRDIADTQYPIYNFKQHKGYWTQKHRDIIKKSWPCDLHRKLFLRKLNATK